MPHLFQSHIHLKPPSPSKTSTARKIPLSRTRTSEDRLSDTRKRKGQFAPVLEEIHSYIKRARLGPGFETPDAPPPPYSPKSRAPPPKAVGNLRAAPVKINRIKPSECELPPYYEVDPVLAASLALQNAMTASRPMSEKAQPTSQTLRKGRSHKLKSTLRN